MCFLGRSTLALAAAIRKSHAAAAAAAAAAPAAAATVTPLSNVKAFVQNLKLNLQSPADSDTCT